MASRRDRSCPRHRHRRRLRNQTRLRTRPLTDTGRPTPRYPPADNSGPRRISLAPGTDRAGCYNGSQAPGVSGASGHAGQFTVSVSSPTCAPCIMSWARNGVIRIFRERGVWGPGSARIIAAPDVGRQRIRRRRTTCSDAQILSSARSHVGVDAVRTSPGAQTRAPSQVRALPGRRQIQTYLTIEGTAAATGSRRAWTRLARACGRAQTPLPVPAAASLARPTDRRRDRLRTPDLPLLMSMRPR